MRASTPRAAARSADGAASSAACPVALIGGGETSVNVGHARGYGGRNQHAALAAAIELDALLQARRRQARPGFDRTSAADGRADRLSIACFATDGVDGVAPRGESAPAGAIVTALTCHHARRAGLDPRDALRRRDSYRFFTALARAGHAALIRPGPTGTNVNDVYVTLCEG